MSTEEDTEEPLPLGDADHTLDRFGVMPTEPLLAKNRSQAFRFLSYGKGTRCVLTDDHYTMLCVGRLADVKAYARGWIRAHRRLHNVVVTKAQEPKMLIMIICSDRWYDRARYLDDEMEVMEEGDDDDGNGDGDGDDDEDYDDYDIQFDDNLPIEASDDFLDAVLAEEMEVLGDGSEGAQDDTDGGSGDENSDMDENPLHRHKPQPLYTNSKDPDLQGTVDDYVARVWGVPRGFRGGSCNNCDSTDHNLARCTRLRHGKPFMAGCPIHNTLTHGVDSCFLLLLASPLNELLLLLFYSTLVAERAGMPAFHSRWLPWTRVLLIARAWGFECEGPFPWSTDFAAARLAEQGLDGGRAAGPGEAVVDPATQDWDALKVAIEAGLVPDPGDVTPWLPPPQFDPMIAEGDDIYEFLGVVSPWPKRRADGLPVSTDGQDE